MATVRVTLRAAQRQYIAGVRTFYIGSFSVPDVEYTLKHIRRPGRRVVTCTCPDFVHREFPLRHSCKHIRAFRALVQEAGGVSRIGPRNTLVVTGTDHRWAVGRCITCGREYCYPTPGPCPGRSVRSGRKTVERRPGRRHHV